MKTRCLDKSSVPRKFYSMAPSDKHGQFKQGNALQALAEEDHGQADEVRGQDADGLNPSDSVRLVGHEAPVFLLAEHNKEHHNR